MTCEHAGCPNEAIDCYLIDDDCDNPSYRYCPDHAPDEGFCAVCGQFVAGSDDMFDFGGSGLCEVCRADIDDDWEDDGTADELIYGEDIP